MSIWNCFFLFKRTRRLQYFNNSFRKWTRINFISTILPFIKTKKLFFFEIFFYFIFNNVIIHIIEFIITPKFLYFIKIIINLYVFSNSISTFPFSLKIIPRLKGDPPWFFNGVFIINFKCAFIILNNPFSLLQIIFINSSFCASITMQNCKISFR